MLHLLLIILALTAGSTVWAEETMYQCEDGTYTNRAELLCQQYEPKGKVLVLPHGMSLASAGALLGESAHTGAPQNVKASDPLATCNLYKEWVSMNMQTGGGVTFRLTQDVPRWVALARIFPVGVAPANCQ